MPPLERAHFVRDRLPAHGPFAENLKRVAAASFPLGSSHVELLEKLGIVLHRFAAACNLLYRQSAAGKALAWVAPLLDAGKPPELVALSRHAKLKGQLPALIRPRLVLTADGFALVGLDAVPEGLALTAWLGETYSALGNEILGGADGIRKGFASALPEGGVLISERHKAERAGLEWLVGKERVQPVEEYAPDGKPACRWFDLFDFSRLAKFRENWQPDHPLTPPLKPYLEEKLWLALFWSRPLQEFWRQEVGEKGQKLLQRVIPYSWVLDPTPLPPHAVIAELGLQSWSEVQHAAELRRELVLKISSPAPDAQNTFIGSRLSPGEWSAQIEKGLAEFAQRPRLLQRFVCAAPARQDYLGDDGQIATLEGRATVRPCYFVVQDRATLGGALVTVAPADATPGANAIFSPAALTTASE